MSGGEGERVSRWLRVDSALVMQQALRDNAGEARRHVVAHPAPAPLPMHLESCPAEGSSAVRASATRQRCRPCRCPASKRAA